MTVLVLSLAITLSLAPLGAMAVESSLTGLSSPTHPDEATWYTDNDPMFEWTGQIPSIVGGTGPLIPPTEPSQCVALSGDTLFVGTDSSFYSLDLANELAPLVLDYVPVLGGVNAIDIEGDVAYLAGDTQTLTTIDISDPGALGVLRVAAWTGIPGLDVVVEGDVAYLACGTGLLRVDVSDPSAVAPIDVVPTAGTANTLTVHGRTVFVGTDVSVDVFDVPSRVTPPVPMTSIPVPGPAIDIAVSGDAAYVAESGVGVETLDISDPWTTTPVDLLPAPDVVSLDVWGDTLHLSMIDGTFAMADVSDALAPAMLDTAVQFVVALGSVAADDIAYVAAGPLGVMVVDVADECSPTTLGSISPLGQTTNYAIDGNVAYLAGDVVGMATVDISDPTNLVTLDTTSLGVLDVVVQGDFAYAACGFAGMRIFDVSDPTNISSISRINDVLMSSKTIAVDGDMAYVLGTSGSNLLSVDVSDPWNPSVVGTSSVLGFAHDLKVEGDVLYKADYLGLETIDISDPTSPVVLDSVSTLPSGLGDGAMSVEIRGNVAYVADQMSGLVSIDISDPSNLSKLDTVANVDYSAGVGVAGNTAYLADEAGGVRVIDITDPTNMSEIGSFDAGGAKEFDVTVVGEIAWIQRGGGLTAEQVRIVPEGYSYTLDTIPTTEPDVTVETSATSTVMTDVPDGLNYFHVNAADGSATGTVTLHRAVMVDTTAPVINAMAVPDGSTPPTFTVTITSSDGLGSGVAGMYYSLDGGAPQVYTVPFDITTPGDHEVTYWAIDNVGLLNADVLEVAIDATPPVTTSDIPIAWQSAEVTVTLDAYDEMSGVAGTRYSVDGGIESSYTVPFVVSGDGEHVVTFYSVDWAGNFETPKAGVVKIDTADPTADDNAPVGWVNESYPFEANADDGMGSGVSSIVVTVTPPPGFGATVTEIAMGDHYGKTVINQGITTFEYHAVDALGHSSASIIATVGVDTIAPATTDDVVATGWQSNDVTVTLSPTDVGSGVAVTYYSVDGWPKQVYSGPFVISNEDRHDIMYWSVDNAGNIEDPQHTETIYIDKTDPILSTYRLPVTGWASGSALAGAQGNDVYSYVEHIWYSINGAPYVSQLGDLFTWLETTEGTTTVDMYAEDGAGNTSGVERVTLLVDNTPPVTTDDAPAGWISSATTVTLDATDPLSGVSETYFTLGGSAVTTYTGPIGVSTEGINTITYWSVDDAGNVEDAKSATVRIDHTGPVVTDDSTSAWQQGPVTVTFTEADAGADASMFYYSLDGSAEATTAASMEATGTGVHELEYYGVDSLGNPGPLGHATIRIDDDDPVSSSDIDSAWQHGPIDVTITATDAHSGVASIETTVTDPPPGSVNSTSTPSDTVTFTVSMEGTTVVEYHAVDAVGNDEDATVEIVRVDDTAPDVSIVPTDSAAIDTITFSIETSDTLSGVAGVYYAVDGGAVVASDTVTLDTVGDHTIEYWAVDVAGNECAHETHDVRVSPSQTTYVEVAGANRYATAIEASRRAFPDGANAVIVATGDDWPDALGGAALAGVYDAPVLLTEKDSLPSDVAAEIKRLDPMHVFVLGGTSVVSEDIEAQIRALVVPTANLERFWGADRYITTEIIAARVTRESLTFDGTAFVATGLSFPDALAAAPLATALERPLYLSGANGLSASGLAAMKNAGVTNVVILGGEAAVPASVEAQLDGISVTHERLAGANRFATAVDVAESGVAAGMSWDKVALANGAMFPDALSGGVMQGHDSAVMMLTPADSLDSGVKTTLEAQRDIIGEARFIGGTTAISQDVRNEVKQVLR